MEFRFLWGEKEFKVEVDPTQEGKPALLQGREVEFRKIAAGKGALVIEVGGRLRRIAYATEGTTIHLSLGGVSYRLERVEALSPAPAHPHHEQGLEAPMPGLVRGVSIAEGDEVERGQTLVLLEAMKMEIRITAPEKARVSKIHCRVGDQVERGQVLVELEGKERSR
jgi:acetyl/propionyl-CoA carboxylase alpha subunit